MRRIIALLAAGCCVLATAPSADAAAVVDHSNDASCGVDPGDIPALPGGVRVVSGIETVVVTPNGGLFYSCSGSLPSGVSVGETVQGYLPCFASATAFTWGHYVVTEGGHLQYTCRFPAGSV